MIHPPLSKTFIQSADPAADYRAHQEAVDQAIQRVLTNGNYILGPEVRAFEGEFAQFLGATAAIGVGSGTDALHLALRACGVGPHDLVATVSHTAVATVAAIELSGAKPLLMDVDPLTFTMDMHMLESVFHKTNGGRIKAVVPVHLYGRPVDMPAVMDLADRYDFMVVEDCAQAHGATIEGRRIGTWGHLAAFSFYPTKNLGALGDGGAVVTNDRGLADRVTMLREYGWSERYISRTPGFNTRLDEIQAAVLRVKLKSLDQSNCRRREIAQQYDAELAATPLIRPSEPAGSAHAYHQYVVRSARRDALKAFMADHAVGTQIHYPVPIHQQPAYEGRVRLATQRLAHTERLCGEILSLPIHPHLSDQEVSRVGQLIRQWSQGCGETEAVRR